MRPIASLSSTLLARKGEARPAMRSPALDDVYPNSLVVEDLGSDDKRVADAIGLTADELPPVLVQRAALTEELARLALASVETASPATRAGRAAFTLRLPAERHLRLRLASAMTQRSAQGLVTEALDAFLSTLPEVEALARRCSSIADLGTRP